MKLAELNEYAQTGAAAVAIIGIFLLGYEVRQTNRQALAETNSSAWGDWADAQLSLLESGIAELEAKAMTNPEGLTLEEKISLGRYLGTWLHLYHENITATDILGIDKDANINRTLDEIALVAPQVFGSRWSRAWLQENEGWMFPDIFEVIEHSLEGAPIGSDLAYYERIDARAAAMD